jgi:proline iminopeptidase
MCFARLVTHYWRHAAWRDENELLDNVTRIAHIPAALIHGRLDVSGPPDIAWKLAEAWPAAELHIVPGMGHESGGAMATYGVAALNDFAAIIEP